MTHGKAGIDTLKLSYRITLCVGAANHMKGNDEPKALNRTPKNAETIRLSEPNLTVGKK